MGQGHEGSALLMTMRAELENCRMAVAEEPEGSHPFESQNLKGFPDWQETGVDSTQSWYLADSVVIDHRADSLARVLDPAHHTEKGQGY